jgi:hypothetical protein
VNRVAISFDQLIQELRGFDQRREIVKAMSKGIRASAPKVRRKIRAAGIAILPEEGGLGAWVARIRINLQIKTGSRSASIKLVGGRNSVGGRSDIAAIDRGRVRAPTFGHRNKGSWHTVAVEPGFFRQTAADADDWHADIDHEVDQALEQLRRGR